jgi:hypothetical protein
MQRAWRPIAAALLATVLAACTGTSPEEPSTGASSQSAATPASDTPEPIDPAIVAALRLDLEAEVARSTILVIEAMRAAADGNRHDDRLAALAGRSAAELDDIVTTVASEADGLSDIWSQRTDALLAAAAGGDDTELPAAHDEIAAFAADVAGLDEADTLNALEDLDGKVLGQLEAYTDDDIERSYTLQREAYSDAVSFAEDLAVGMAGDSGPAATTGRVELNSALRQLVGEHAALTVVAARRAGRSAKDSPQAAAALNGNTEDLTAALLNIYDEDGAVAFDELWRELIGGVMAATVATAEHAPRKARAARREVADTVDDLAEHLEEMTEETLSATDAAAALTRHSRLLVEQGAAFARGRWEAADVAAWAVLGHSTELADLLATAIADHRPADFPA